MKPDPAKLRDASGPSILRWWTSHCVEGLVRSGKTEKEAISILSGVLLDVAKRIYSGDAVEVPNET